MTERDTNDPTSKKFERVEMNVNNDSNIISKTDSPQMQIFN